MQNEVFAKGLRGRRVRIECPTRLEGYMASVFFADTNKPLGNVTRVVIDMDVAKKTKASLYLYHVDSMTRQINKEIAEVDADVYVLAEVRNAYE